MIGNSRGTLASMTVFLLLAGVLAGCGGSGGGRAHARSASASGSTSPSLPPWGTAVPPSPVPGPSGPTNLIPDGYQGRVEASGSVEENAEHGPRLCTATLAMKSASCSGIDLVGWSWAGLEHERGSSFTVVGTFDGTKLHVTEPPKLAPPRPGRASDDLRGPCQPPPGGWPAADPAKTSSATLDEAIKRASASPDYAGSWYSNQAGGGAYVNDPASILLNVRFTGNLARHETQLRAIWGGALCVSAARYTEAYLKKIMDDIQREPGIMMLGEHVMSNSVEVDVYAAYAARQRALDAQYGPGAVWLVGFLKPIN